MKVSLLRSIGALAALFTMLVAPASSAFASDYRFSPFTDLNGVCPTCQPPAGDVIALKSGQKVHGTVIAVNSSFYTINRYGEVRTVSRAEAQDVVWQQGQQPAGIDKLDQIVLKNGHVLTGSITSDNERGRLLRSTTPSQTFFVAHTETSAVFKKGVEAS